MRLCFGWVLLPALSVGMALGASHAWAQESPPKMMNSKPVKTSGPKIEVVESNHDFGEVWSGQPIDFTFMVKNMGDALLKITNVKPSCGCTVKGKYDREIKPGELGKVPVTVNTTKLRASRVTKSVTISSNDPERPTVRVALTGEIKHRIAVEPDQGARFGRIKAGDKLDRTLTLRNNTKGDIALSLPTDRAGVFKGELTAKESGKLYELRVTSDGPFAEGINRGTFRLKTDIADQPTMEIDAMAQVPPRLEVQPTDIIVPSATNSRIKRAVNVTFNTAEAYKVLSGETSVKDAEVEIRNSGNAAIPNRYTVSIELPANYVPPAAGDKMTLKTDDPKNPTIEVKLMQRRQIARRPAPRRRPSQELAGKPAPGGEFKLTSGEGEVDLSKTEDKTTLAMFYASWCGFCKKGLPMVNEMRHEMEGKPIRFVAVSLDTIVATEAEKASNKRARTVEDITSQWKDMGLSIPQAMDSNSVGRTQYRVSSFPTLFLINKSGKIERVYAGIGELTSGTVRKEIDQLLAGKELAAQAFADAAAAPRTRQRPAQMLEGKPVPAATFELAAGGKFSTTSSDDKASLMMFYASWCGFCKRALPELNKMWTETYKDKDVRFVGVSLDTIVATEAEKATNKRARTRDEVVKQWNEDFSIKFAQALDTEHQGSSLFKVTSFPTLILVGKSGKIEKVYVGGGAVKDGTLKKDLDTLLEGKSLQAKADTKAGGKEEPIRVTSDMFKIKPRLKGE